MAEHTRGPWHIVPHGDGDSLVICDDEEAMWRICFMATPGSAGSWDKIKANTSLIAAAPDYAEACGLTLDPGENETCGPLSWLRTAIDTLKEDGVREAASGDDSDAYRSMINEVETLLAQLKAASAKARGEQ